jgi:tellurite resistance protein
MARRKKSDGGLGLVLILGLIIALAAVPKQIWIAVAVIGGIWLTYRIYKHFAPKPTSLLIEPMVKELTRSAVAELSPEKRRRALEVARRAQEARAKATSTPAVPQSVWQTDAEASSGIQSASVPRVAAPPVPTAPSPEFYAATMKARTAPAPEPRSHAIPVPPPATTVKGRWIAANQRVKFRELAISGGLFYIGHTLESPSGGIDPCLINIRLNIAKWGDFTVRQMDYWPSYSGISAEARCAYLNWLIEGRSAANCDIGFVFLFFYGLERRVLVDTQSDPDAAKDLPAITTELRRLIAIYGPSSGSFRNYANGLLDWIELGTLPDRLYARPVPTFEPSYELPMYLRIALGQASLDRAPVPAALALQWARVSPEVRLRTAANRCAEVFDQLFMETYSRVHGSGIVLTKNRTRFKFIYQAASAGLRRLSPFSRTFGDIPDVSVLKAPLKALQEIADQCTDALGTYSRLLGRDPTAGESIEGLLCLPPSLWPAHVRQRVHGFAEGLAGAGRTMSIDALLREFDPAAAEKVSRDITKGIATALAAFGVGIEPNVLEGARAPKSGDPVVVFRLQEAEAPTDAHDGYQIAVLTLQLASAVAYADGSIDKGEVAHLEAEIERWGHLTPAHRCRLRAHLTWLAANPLSLASLKKKLEPLGSEARETLALCMVTLAHADGEVSPKEISLLEKIYKALGVDPQRLFSDIHAVGTGRSAPVSTADTGFRLDTGRIAALQRDTEKVSALLADIFVDEEERLPAEEEVEEPTLDDSVSGHLLGLDEIHGEFVRLILSRPQWSRSELEDAAADLDLMLDGALELINDAAFEAHDEALIEGDDPMDVNQDIKEALEA